MICTQCGAPGLTFDLAGTHLVRCLPCSFCWLAEDTVVRLREVFGENSLSALKITIGELKRRARGASVAVLLELVEELGRAEDLVFDQEEEGPARPARRRPPATDSGRTEPAFPDTAAKLAATLAKKRKL